MKMIRGSEKRTFRSTKLPQNTFWISRTVSAALPDKPLALRARRAYNSRRC